MDKFGKMVRKAREQKGHSVKQMAKAVGISEAFANCVEHAKHVPISPRVVEALSKKYDIKPRGGFEKAAELRNRVGKKWYKEYHKKANAKKAKRSKVDVQDVAPVRDVQKLFRQVLDGKLTAAKARKLANPKAG